MSKENAPESELSKVMNQLEALKKTRTENSPSLTPAASAARAAIDFGSACAVGCLLGYGVDHWFDTAPWGIIVGATVGTIAGFKLMWHAVMKDVDKEPK